MGCSDPFELESGGEADDIIVTLGAGGTISGTVTDAQGQPLADYDMSVMSGQRIVPFNGTFNQYIQRTAKTASGGSYVIDRVSPGNVNVTAAKPKNGASAGGYGMMGMGMSNGLSKRKEAEIADGGTAIVDFVFENTEDLKGYIAGRVVDPEGKPLPGINVTAVLSGGRLNDENPGGMTGTAITDTEGKFNIQNLQEKKTYSVQSVNVGNDTGNMDMDMEQVITPADDVVLTLSSLGKGNIEGVVLDPSIQIAGQAGVPVKRFKLRAQALSSMMTGLDLFQQGKMFSNSDGSFKLTDIGTGVYKLIAGTDDGKRGVVESVEVKDGETTSGVVILLEGGQTVRGIVTSPDGPAARASIFRIQGIRSQITNMMQQAEPEAVTDENGRFEIENIQDRTISLRAEHSNYAPKSVYDIDISAADALIPIQLTNGGRIEGHAYDASGNPVTGFELHANSQTDNSSSRSGTDSEGAFAFENLSPGSYTVQYGMQQMLTLKGVSSVQCLVREGETTTVDLGKGGVTISGQVRRGGEPVQGAYVIVMPQNPSLDTLGILGSSQADESGMYQLGGLPSGEHMLMVGEGNLITGMQSPIAQQQISVPEPGEYSFDIEIPATVFSGIVIGGQEEPIPSAQLVLKPRDMGNPFSAGPRGRCQSGEDGVFSFQSPAPGEYYLNVVAPGYANYDKPLSIPSGESVTDYRVVMSQLFGGITGGWSRRMADTPCRRSSRPTFLTGRKAIRSSVEAWLEKWLPPPASSH